jgi:predicted lipopolysaccharide heptosyltransferase III
VKILVIQLKRIGDLILTTPALRALRRRFPDARVTIAIERGSRELLPALTSLDETLVYARGNSNARVWRRLILGTFDVCLDFTGSDRSLLFSILSKSRQRIAFTPKSRLKAMLYNKLVDSPVRKHHTIDHYLHLLRPLDVDAVDEPIALDLPAWCEKKSRQIMAESRLTPPFIIVHPGAARAEKYWLPERWAEVITVCSADVGLSVAITGSEDSYEQAHIKRIREFLRIPHIDLSGRTDLLTLAALARKARLFLSVDSAPMHLAAASQVPQIALFGPTNPFHWRPRHARAITLLAGANEPNPPLQPRHDSRQMSEISTEQVIRATANIIYAQQRS